MPSEISRREFMRRMAAAGYSTSMAVILFSQLACGKEIPAITPTANTSQAPEPAHPPSSTATPTNMSSLTTEPITTASAPAVPTSPTAVPSTMYTATPSTIPSALPSISTLPITSYTPATGLAYLAAARGQSPTAMVQAAIKALGGIERFVKAGADVIIKPNICVAYHTYEYAATTNPEVIGTLVALCRSAGASRVRVMDQPFGGTADQNPTEYRIRMSLYRRPIKRKQ
jgi:hypothetical protein